MSAPSPAHKLAALSRSPFRAKFQLSAKDGSYLAERDSGVIRRHAFSIIAARLAPANPRKDGKQTPFEGHPVFTAQHATATCCRFCMKKWHAIPLDRPMQAVELVRVVDLVCLWLERRRTPAKQACLALDGGAVAERESKYLTRAGMGRTAAKW